MGLPLAYLSGRILCRVVVNWLDVVLVLGLGFDGRIQCSHHNEATRIKTIHSIERNKRTGYC